MTLPTPDRRPPASASLRPGDFCRLALETIAASEGRRRRRKRDQTPDAIGLSLKCDLYTRAVEADPEPEAFESWLLAQVLTTPGAGSVRALAAEILAEYRFAAADPTFRDWLRSGAPSADAEPL